MFPLRWWVILSVLSVALRAESSVALPTLDWLESHAPREGTDAQTIEAFHDQVVRLIESNALVSGRDYFRAAVAASFGISDAHKTQVRYELLLVAIARDDQEAVKMLPAVWDWFMAGRGRPMRFDVDKVAAQYPDRFDADPAPAVIQLVWRAPEKARGAAATAKDNPEIKQIVDADQAARAADWDKLSPDAIKAISAADAQRNARIRAIVAAGDLHTAEDFANASLVMQHSDKFTGYELAHELAVCSLLLGDRAGGRWLVAATYDRMLQSIGFRQRFGTQYVNDAPTRIDPEAICDEERRALGCPSLEARRGDDAVRRAEQLCEAKQFAEAEVAAREGVELRAKSYAPTNWHAFSAKRVLGLALLEQRKYAEAETVLLDAYRGLSAPGSELPDGYRNRITDTAGYLVRLYDEQHQPEKAAVWKKRSSAP